MSPSLLITPSVSSPVVSVDAEARALRDRLLADAGTVTTVTDRLDADSAIVVLRSLKSFLTDIEAAREAVKAPVLKVSREIDALAKELVAEVKTHEARIARLCGSFEAEERRKAEDAAQAARNEAARIAFEASKATRLAVASAPTAEAGARAADAIAGAAQTAIHEVKAAAVAIAPPKPPASQLRADVCFEVTDMAAFYAAQPTLVKLEPNGPAIRAILKANPNIVIPGLRHWTDEKLNLR
jgi:hypothetical protein